MAKLVSVYRNDKQKLSKRQLPLFVDKTLTMVMDLNLSGLVPQGTMSKGKEQERFMMMYFSLQPNERKEAFQVDFKEFSATLSQSVPCVGCRRSVERLYCSLAKAGHSTLEPLEISRKGVLSIQDDTLKNPASLGVITQEHNAKLDNLVESQLRSKKSRRCALHSLDTQRVRAPWREVWDIMKPQCREEVVLIDIVSLMSTLEGYLHKHRFCGDCRTKVLKAYWLLVDEEDPIKEKGYIPALYGGIKRCIPDKHLHLPTNTEYISALISRIQPDLLGSGGERHAKTLEIAQGEVVTCLGLCVYERLHKVHLRLKEEETTCQVLAAVAIKALCRKFMITVERKKTGLYEAQYLDLLCEEFAELDMVKQQKKEQKKLKRKKRKEKKLGISLEDGKLDIDQEQDVEIVEENRELITCKRQSSMCMDEENNDPANSFHETNKLVLLKKSDINDFCKECGDKKESRSRKSKDAKESVKTEIKESPPLQPRLDNKNTVTVNSCSSGAVNKQTEKINNKSVRNENSQKRLKKSNKKLRNENNSNGCHLQCFNGGINDSSREHTKDYGYSSTNYVSSSSSSPDGSEAPCEDDNSCIDMKQCNITKLLPTEGFRLSLQDMLDSAESSDEGSGIPIEDVQQFYSVNKWTTDKRVEFRNRLKQSFQNLCVSWNSDNASDPIRN